jgi:hypothetical protein
MGYVHNCVAHIFYFIFSDLVSDGSNTPSVLIGGNALKGIRCSYLQRSSLCLKARPHDEIFVRFLWDFGHEIFVIGPTTSNICDSTWNISDATWDICEQRQIKYHEVSSCGRVLNDVKHLWDFVRRCFMKMVRAAKCRTFMKHYETTSNKISRKSHRMDGP